MTPARFQKTIWDHYRAHGRTMPWRDTKNPYRILVSEIMLQQTQVGRVEGFYKDFIRQFPDFRTLASAKVADVLRAWQGLGYNRRALSLQRLAQTVVKDYAGKLPRDRTVLESLPGIGKGTSGSLMAFAFNEPVVFIETNIRRVFIHFFFADDRTNVVDDEIMPLVEKTLDRKNPREWYWALMDYGALLGRAKSVKNPNLRSAHYVSQSKFSGSDRQLRGKILRLVISRKRMSLAAAVRILGEQKERVTDISKALIREGFMTRNGNSFAVRTHLKRG